MASDNNRLLNSKSKKIVYSVSECFNQKEASRTPYLERTAEASDVNRATVARIRHEKSLARMLFPGSVETWRKHLNQLGYYWKKASCEETKIL